MGARENKQTMNAAQTPQRSHTTRRTKKQYVEKLMKRALVIRSELSAHEVAKTLAIHMSLNFQLLNFVATNYVQRINRVVGKSLEEQLGGIFARLFDLPLRLEVRSEQVSTGGAVRGELYLFGMEQPFYSVPLQFFRCCMTSWACLIRLLYEPGQQPEGMSFMHLHYAIDNAEIRYSGFEYNATMNAIFSRFSLLCALCVSISATSSVLQAKFASDNDLLVMRVLVHGALTRLVEHISAPEVRRNRVHLNDALVHRVHRLVALCAAVETFNSVSIMALAAENFRTVARAHKVRIAV